MKRVGVRRQTAAAAALWAASGAWLAACDAVADSTEQRNGAIVYGEDDRRDYFDVPAAQATRAPSMVALVADETLRAANGDLAAAPTWREKDGLCPDEPFADQPAAAFCSGVLVDWDLVLTAGHCTRLHAIQDFKIVLDYHYARPRELAAAPAEVVAVAEIVAERLDPAGSDPRLDYAWLRLARPVTPPRLPAPLYVGPHPLKVGDGIVSVGTGGGIPMKWDGGGRVQDARVESADFFIVDADSSHGGSGGGGFDNGLVLTGITARGGADAVVTPAGCLTTVREPDAARASEQLTYAFRAVEGLCATAPEASSICRADCGNPCQALAPTLAPDGGCSVAPRSRSGAPPSHAEELAITAAAGLLLLARRASRRCRSLILQPVQLDRGGARAGIEQVASRAPSLRTTGSVAIRPPGGAGLFVTGGMHLPGPGAAPLAPLVAAG